MLQSDMRLFHKGSYHDMRECSNNMHEINKQLCIMIGSCRAKPIDEARICYRESSDIFSLGRLKFVRKYLVKRETVSSQANETRAPSNRGLKRGHSPDREAGKNKSSEMMLQYHQRERKRMKLNADESCVKASLATKPQTAASSRRTLKLTLMRRKCNYWIVKNNLSQSKNPSILEPSAFQETMRKTGYKIPKRLHVLISA